MRVRAVRARTHLQHHLPVHFLELLVAKDVDHSHCHHVGRATLDWRVNSLAQPHPNSCREVVAKKAPASTAQR